MKLFYTIFILCVCTLNVFSQHQTQTLRNDIRTLRVQYVEDIEAGNNVSLRRPFLTLNGTDWQSANGNFNNNVINGSDPNNTVEVSFDQLSHDIHLYTYIVKHLNADWRESALESYEYLSGFTTVDITDYERSLNTQQIYTHYRFTFPNEDMRITRSGNYVIVIYENGQPENIVAEVCLSIVEPLAEVQANITANTMKEVSGRYQQLELSVSANIHESLPDALFVCVTQNNRMDNAVFHPAPTMVEGNRLQWHNCPELVFEGGHEYRHFDSWSTYYGGHHVDRIRYDQNDFHLFLEPDYIRGIWSKNANRTGERYVHEFDENGQYRVNAERVLNDIDTEAEYMWVHWVVPMENPIFDGGLYVLGDIFYNKFSFNNRMLYDNEHHCYYLNALVKQGGYDYLIALAKRNEVTLLQTEGSHWETNNQYCVYVYYRPASERADRLVGLYQSSSSM